MDQRADASSSGGSAASHTETLLQVRQVESAGHFSEFYELAIRFGSTAALALDILR